MPTYGFDSCNSCKRLVPSRLHELQESKFPFVSRIAFIRSKLSNFSAHVSGVTVRVDGGPAVRPDEDAYRLRHGRVGSVLAAPLFSTAGQPYRSPTPVSVRRAWLTPFRSAAPPLCPGRLPLLSPRRMMSRVA